MTERLPQHEGKEFKAHQEAEPSHERAHHKANPEHESRHEKNELAPVKELEKQAEEEAIASNELPIHEKSKPRDSDLYVSRELHQQTFNRTMTHIRKKLSAPSKVLSKVVHQPVVNAVSEAGGKTVARPSGVLMGGICAFLASSVVLWMAKYYGFAYNYLLFLIVFVGGFGLGLALEFVLWVFKRKKA